MTDATNLFNERVQLYKDAARHKKTSRVLNLANIWTWKICDSGYKLSEALFDYNKMEDIVCKFHEKYQFDFYMDYGLRNPLRIPDVLGFTDYIIDDDTCSLTYATDINYMTEEDYDLIIENFDKYLWTRCTPGRVCSKDKGNPSTDHSNERGADTGSGKHEKNRQRLNCRGVTRSDKNFNRRQPGKQDFLRIYRGRCIHQ